MLDSLCLGKAAVVAAVLTLHHGLMLRVRLAEFEVVLTCVDTACGCCRGREVYLNGVRETRVAKPAQVLEFGILVSPAHVVDGYELRALTIGAIYIYHHVV